MADFTSIFLLSRLKTLSSSLSDKVSEIYKKAAAEAIAAGYGSTISESMAYTSISEHLSKIENFNTTTYYEILEALNISSTLEDEDGGLVDTTVKLYLAKILIQAIFERLRTKRKPLIIESTVYGPHNNGMFDAVQSSNDAGFEVKKQWVSRKDSRVRPSHRLLDGQKVPFNNAFYVDNVALRFPGDPLAPASSTINCRCYLRLSK